LKKVFAIHDNEEDLLQLIALNQYSEHPWRKPLLILLKQKNIDLLEAKTLSYYRKRGY
jgi:hypothetical protein